MTKENLAFTGRAIAALEATDRHNANPPPHVMLEYLHSVGRIGWHAASGLATIKHIDGKHRIAVSLIDASIEGAVRL